MFDKMYGKCFGIIKTVGAAIMLLLVICALTGTWYMFPGGEEVSRHQWDSLWKNFLAVVLCGALFLCFHKAEKRFGGKVCRILSGLSLAAAVIWVFAVSIWWIFSAERRPVGDQAFIYGGASYFRMGDYSFLEEGGYCHIYPYQLGLISLVELVYFVAEPLTYRPLQVINALAAVGIVCVGYGLVKKWSDAFETKCLYCVTISFCFPLFFYTPWVYGDIISIFLALLAAFFLCCYEKREKKGWLAGVVLALTFAQLARQSTTIVYVAFVLIVLARFMKKRDKKLLAAAVISVALPLVIFSGIYKMYEVRSGTEHSNGIPIAVTLAMGMQESRQGCGWDNNYQKDVYNASVFDTVKMQKTGMQELAERVSFFVKNPVFAAQFYGKKILSQWNAPLYQSVFFTADYRQSAPPQEGSLARNVDGTAFWAVLDICDRLQFVVYLGMLFWYLLAGRQDKGILRQLLALAVIGGFCFSLLWEAKTRYILPYYLFMFPCAAVGYEELLKKICSYWPRMLKNKKRL